MKYKSISIDDDTYQLLRTIVPTIYELHHKTRERISVRKAIRECVRWYIITEKEYKDDFLDRFTDDEK
jgi:hypothetical protein